MPRTDINLLIFQFYLPVSCVAAGLELVTLAKKTHLTFDPNDGNLNHYHTLQPEFAKYYGAYTRDIQGATANWSGRINEPMLLPDQSKGNASLGSCSRETPPFTVPPTVEVNHDWAAGSHENLSGSLVKKAKRIKTSSAEMESNAPLPDLSTVLNGNSME